MCLPYLPPPYIRVNLIYIILLTGRVCVYQSMRELIRKDRERLRQTRLVETGRTIRR